MKPGCQPVLRDLLVLDFSSLLPGPLATLILAEAGARVVKIERPSSGDEMRHYEPKFGPDSANFALLNRGKDSLALDLKTPDDMAQLKPLLAKADILVEQFRPGVMERLGLGYDAVAALNPSIVYCSISGYGKSGPNVAKPGHDLNYMAETGCLSLVTDGAGRPVLPHLLNADIGGGAYPAVMNILMALLRREQSGEGAYIDISMSDNLFTYLYWALAEGFGAGSWPTGGSGLVTGASPRYALYPTQDGRYLAVAALEEQFWKTFCETIGLNVRNAEKDSPETLRAKVAERIVQRTAADWERAFAGLDVCCSIVASVEEAVASSQVQERGIFQKQVTRSGKSTPALPLPISPLFQGSAKSLPSPDLGQFSKKV